MSHPVLQNLRASATCSRVRQSGVVALCLLADWFFSTEPGMIIGIVLVPLTLL
jgi:hypothetical protein